MQINGVSNITLARILHNLLRIERFGAAQQNDEVNVEMVESIIDPSPSGAFDIKFADWCIAEGDAEL